MYRAGTPNWGWDAPAIASIRSEQFRFAQLKNTKPIQFKENIALVLKYFDKLAPLMQENSNLRPAD